MPDRVEHRPGPKRKYRITMKYVAARAALRKDEVIRRLRLGNIKTLLRWRCGLELPDDDAGREYLYELLLPISLGPEPDLKMDTVMEVWAPWMDAKERFDLVANIEQTPVHVRKITAKTLGARLQVTAEERKTLRLWTIAAYDVTEQQREAEQRASKRARQERHRRRRGSRPRAESIAQRKPWQAHGISRRTWYRQRGTDKGRHGTDKRRTKASIEQSLVCATEQAESQKVGSREVSGWFARAMLFTWCSSLR